MSRSLLLTLFLMLWPITSLGSDWEPDPSETEVGIHVISNFGKQQRIVTSIISERTIHDTLQSLDWDNGFYQVVVVTSRGVSMEVGGSLDPGHGLSAVYGNRTGRTEAVTMNPPETVEEMESILFAFIRKRWLLGEEL